MTKGVNLIYDALFGENIWYAKRFNLYHIISNLITDCDDLIEKYATVYDEYTSLVAKVPLIFNGFVNFTNSNMQIKYTTLNMLLNEFQSELEELKQIKHFFEILLDIVNQNSLFIDALQKASCAAIILILSIIIGCFDFRNNFSNAKDYASLFIFIVLSELCVFAGLCYKVRISIEAKQNSEQQLLYKFHLRNRNFPASGLPCFEEITDNISVQEETCNYIKKNFERLDLLLSENAEIFKKYSCLKSKNISHAFIQEQLHEEQALISEGKKSTLNFSAIPF